MNAEKRTTTLKVLSDNQKALLATLEKVDADLFLHQPAGGRWSIAGLVEHIMMVENGVLAGIKKAGMQPKTEAIKKAVTDEKLGQLLRNRNIKLDAPAHFVPKGTFTNKTAAVAAFNNHRANIADFVNTTDLPLSFIGFPHPALGMLNGMDWIVFMAGHCERHILQMEEVKLSV